MLGGGVVLLALALISPITTLAEHYLLTAHLIQVTVVMAVVPPLMLLAIPRSTSLRIPRVARAVMRFSTHPVVAMIAVNVVFFGWHATALYDPALRNPMLYSLQQSSLFLVSLAFWWPIVRPNDTSRLGTSPLLKLGYILFATIPQTFAGITVALSHQPLYHHYVSAPRILGVGVMADQEIAGACMALLSKIALFAAFSIVFFRMLNATWTQDDDDSGGSRRQRPEAPTPCPASPAPAPSWWSQLGNGPTVPEPKPIERPTPIPAGTSSSRE
jgi:putative membrane protein